VKEIDESVSISKKEKYIELTGQYGMIASA
jgi:hypothetical protein